MSSVEQEYPICLVRNKSSLYVHGIVIAFFTYIVCMPVVQKEHSFVCKREKKLSLCPVHIMFFVGIQLRRQKENHVIQMSCKIILYVQYIATSFYMSCVLQEHALCAVCNENILYGQCATTVVFKSDIHVQSTHLHVQCSTKAMCISSI